MFIPDPIEMMESQIENAIDRMHEVGEGHCINCGKKIEYDLIPPCAHPAAWAVCFECLNAEDQKKHGGFEARQSKEDK